MSSTNKYSDEDNQAFTMQQIVDMLVAAGYFRARISGLDAFDKIVGGMSWAITASGVPVEVDVNFKENANIGEKMYVLLFIFYIISLHTINVYTYIVIYYRIQFNLRKYYRSIIRNEMSI